MDDLATTRCLSLPLISNARSNSLGSGKRGKSVPALGFSVDALFSRVEAAGGARDNGKPAAIHARLLEGHVLMTITQTTLGEAIRRLASSLPEDAIICARQPWTPNSDCLVVLPEEDFGVPTEVAQQGFAYFLEVHVAREVLGVFGEKEATLDEQIRLLIHYAQSDAYPEWVYRR